MMKKHALITGGSRGIGLDTTMLFLEHGYKVTVLARNIEPVKNLENCIGIKFDLENINGIELLISEMENIDILVNNAGIMNTFPFDNYPDDEKNRLLKINLEAPIKLMTCVSKKMIVCKKGRIINNASIAGQIGHPDIWYGITKAGLINATKSFAQLLGSHGIIVNVIAAGPVETEMMQYIPQARQEKILKNVYTNRFAQSIEIAQTIFWLATEAPEYINGTCIDINNGAYLR